MNSNFNHMQKAVHSGGRFMRILSVLIVIGFLNALVSEASPVLHGSVSGTSDGDSRKITGVITDGYGEPIIGANIMVQGTDIGAISDIDGSFSCNVPSEGRLIITYLGFEDLFVPLTEQSRYVLVMKENATVLEDVVVVGYGTQKKESVVGAITQVDGESLVNSGISNITNAIAGKLSGVTTLQSSSQPGQSDAEIIIRGISSFDNSSPLVLVDGVERDFASIDPNEVASISVLKDASATAVFGAKGANGVIIVTTKNGFIGAPKMDVSYSTGFSMPINVAEHVDSYTTMSLMNVAKMNDQRFSELTSQAILNEYRHPSSRLNSLLYPDVNWFKEMTRPFANTTNANFSIQGGTKFVKYFASVGYMHEGSLFKSFDIGQFNTGYKYDRINFRTNVDFNVTSSTLISFKLGGSVGIQNQPNVGGTSSQSVWMNVFGASTARYPMTYPAWVLEEIPDPDYPDASGERLSAMGDQSTSNPYTQMVRGRMVQNTSTKLFSDIIINQNLDFITEGLSVQGKVSLSTYYNYRTLQTDIDRPMWMLDLSKVGTGENPWTRQGDTGYVYVEEPYYTTVPNSLQSGYYLDLYYDFSVNYNRTFGKHNVTGLFLFNRQEQDRGTDFPYYNEALVARATYDYAHKYLLEVNMGYTGSERFSPKNRYGFFPSGAVGWVVSEEKFFAPLKPWFSKLKIRYSQGLVGSDYAKNRWLYISEYTRSGNYINEDKVANEDVQWEEAMKKDLGIELGFFNNELTVNVDLFDEHRTKMLIPVDNSTPMWVGNTSKEMNRGEIKKHGIEVEASYRKQFGKDWTMFVGGNFSFNENRVLYWDDAPGTAEYQKRTGAPIGAQLSGAYLIGNGYYTSVDDIHSNIIQTTVDNLVIGDYKFLDFNADGSITEDDLARMEGNYYPPIAFAFNGGFSWKGLEVSFLFQGYAQKWVNFDQMYEWAFTGENYKTHISSLDYWSPANPDGNHCAVHYLNTNIPSMQWAGFMGSATTGGYNAKIEGRSWRRADYLRLKDVSISYTWRGPKLKQILGLDALKLYATGNNLLTVTDLIEGDPEVKYHTWGGYPQAMTVKLGLQLSF